jgi:hypothetical protein
MVSSKATTVREYLTELPADRRAVVAAVRKVILDNLPPGFEEGMQYGMLGYRIPRARHPDTYNGQPLGVASLAAQKNYYSLYLMGVYGDREFERWFEQEFRRAGKKLDKGKSCVRFKKLEDLPLDVIGQAIARVGVEDLIAMHDAVHGPGARTAKDRPVVRTRKSERHAQPKRPLSRR